MLDLPCVGTVSVTPNNRLFVCFMSVFYVETCAQSLTTAHQTFEKLKAHTKSKLYIAWIQYGREWQIQPASLRKHRNEAFGIQAPFFKFTHSSRY